MPFVDFVMRYLPLLQDFVDSTGHVIWPSVTSGLFVFRSSAQHVPTVYIYVAFGHPYFRVYLIEQLYFLYDVMFSSTV